MLVHAGRVPSDPTAPFVTLVDGRTTRAGEGSADGGGGGTGFLTGNVVLAARADDEPSAPLVRKRPGFDRRSYDYDGSGTLDTADAHVLADVIDRKRFCPPEKICDVDESGVVDLRDLGVFNARLLEQELQSQAVQERITAASSLSGKVVANDGFVANDVRRGLLVERGAVVGGEADFWIATTGAH
jgi:hypothetical protein